MATQTQGSSHQSGLKFSCSGRTSHPKSRTLITWQHRSHMSPLNIPKGPQKPLPRLIGPTWSPRFGPGAPETCRRGGGLKRASPGACQADNGVVGGSWLAIRRAGSETPISTTAILHVQALKITSTCEPPSLSFGVPVGGLQAQIRKHHLHILRPPKEQNKASSPAMRNSTSLCCTVLC